jgi:hypothetical protein
VIFVRKEQEMKRFIGSIENERKKRKPINDNVIMRRRKGTGKRHINARYLPLPIPLTVHHQINIISLRHTYL